MPIRIEESPPFGVIIAGIEVIIAGFGVVVIATITEGVDRGCFFAAISMLTFVNQITPSIVEIGVQQVSVTAVNTGNIALGIGGEKVNDVIRYISCAIIGIIMDRAGIPLAVIKVSQIVGYIRASTVVDHLTDDLRAVQIILSSETVYNFGRTDSVSIVLIGYNITALGITGEPSALPGIGCPVVGQGIADGIIGDRVTIKGSQLILPGRIHYIIILTTR